MDERRVEASDDRPGMFGQRLDVRMKSLDLLPAVDLVLRMYWGGISLQ